MHSQDATQRDTSPAPPLAFIAFTFHLDMSQTPYEDSQYGSTGRLDEPASPYHLQENQEDAEPNDEGDDAESSLDDEYEMSLTELLYSSASYHAIVKPGIFLYSCILPLF